MKLDNRLVKTTTKHTVYIYLAFSFPVSIIIVLVWELFVPSIGANIGGGLLVGMGFLLTLVGLIGFIITGTSKVKKIAIAILFGLLLLLPSASFFLEHQSDKHFCREKRDKNEAIFQENVAICKEYFPNFDYMVVE